MREEVRRKEGKWKGQRKRRVDCSTLSVWRCAGYSFHRSLICFLHFFGICWGFPWVIPSSRDRERETEKEAAPSPEMN